VRYFQVELKEQEQEQEYGACVELYLTGALEMTLGSFDHLPNKPDDPEEEEEKDDTGLYDKKKKRWIGGN